MQWLHPALQKLVTLTSTPNVTRRATSAQSVSPATMRTGSLAPSLLKMLLDAVDDSPGVNALVEQPPARCDRFGLAATDPDLVRIVVRDHAADLVVAAIDAEHEIDAAGGPVPGLATCERDLDLGFLRLVLWIVHEEGPRVVIVARLDVRADCQTVVARGVGDALEKPLDLWL